MNRLFLVTIGCIVLTICLVKTGKIDYDDSVRGAVRTTMWNVKYLCQSVGKTARRFTHRTNNEDVVVQFADVPSEPKAQQPVPIKEEKKKPATIGEALTEFSSQMKTVVKELATTFLQRETLDIINTADFNPDRFQKTFVMDSTRALGEGRVSKVFMDDAQSIGSRLANVATAQTKLLQATTVIRKAEALRVGIAFNGNGYRGMLLSLGYAAGLAEIGVWDTATYVTATSGATWFLSVLMAMVQKNSTAQPSQVCTKVLNHFLEKINNQSFSLTDKKALENFLSQASLESFVMSVLAPKVFFQQPIRSVDFYGGLLATTLLSGIVDNPHQRCLSDEWELGGALKDGRWPFPVRAAVALVDDGYRWYEFNPLEVRDTKLNMSVWTSGFGRKYMQGMSEIVAPETIKQISKTEKEEKEVVAKVKLIGEYGPEERLEFLMGLWGSAYTTNTTELKKEIQNRIEGRKIQWQQVEKTWDALKQKLIADLKDKLTLVVLKKLEQDERVGDNRISPAQVNNFLRQCGSSYCPSPTFPTSPAFTPRPVSTSVSDADYTTMVDASLSFDMSLPVLFQQQRNLDVIIVGDAAADMELGTHYQKFFEYLKEKEGIEYERTDDKKDTTLSIWKPKGAKKAPVIISINFKRDDKLLDQIKKDPILKKFVDDYGVSSFDHVQALNTYASNFNFTYTAEQCKKLYGIGAFNMRAHEKVIVGVLRDKLKTKLPAGHDDSDIVFGGDDDGPGKPPVHTPEEHKDDTPQSGTALLDALNNLVQKLGDLSAGLR